MCPGNCQRKAMCECVWQPLAGLLLPCKKGRFPSDSDLGQRQAAGPGPRLCCAESRDFGAPGVAFGCRSWGREEGSAVAAEESCLCALRHVHVSSEGQACQGAVAQHPGLVWSGHSAADALWSSRMGQLPCLLPRALTLGRRAVLLNGAPGMPLGTARQILCGSTALRWPSTHSWTNSCLFIDRYIYIFMNGNSSGMLWRHLPGWWPSICDVLGRIVRLTACDFSPNLTDLGRPGEQNSSWRLSKKHSNYSK